MNRLKELRLSRNMKQADLARLLNVTGNAISNYEVGVRDLDSVTICRLCDIFECTADYLLGRSAVRSPALTPEEQAALLAFRAAPPEIRAIIDTALAPYREEPPAASAV